MELRVCSLAASARRIFLFLLGIAALVVAATGIWLGIRSPLLLAQEVGGRPPATTAIARLAAQSSQPATTPTPSPVEQQLLRQQLYRNREVERDLMRAANELVHGNTVEGLAAIQQLIDRPGDAFVWVNGSPLPSSLRREALRFLAGQPAEVLAAYQRTYGPEADRLLRDAAAANDPYRFEEVARRFSLTDAGFTAADWCASRWFDRGRFDRAARQWNDLLSHPAHKQRVTPVLFEKLWLAHRLGGRAELAARLMAQRDQILPQSTDAAARDLEARLASSPPAVVSVTKTPDWLMAFGDPQRNRSTDATTPLLRPLWSYSLLGESEDWLRELVENWESNQAGTQASTAVANSAIVVRDQVVVRDALQLVAHDLATGRRLWRFPCETSLINTARQLSGQSRRGRWRRGRSGAAHLNFQLAYAGNSTLGMLSSDGRRVFLVDSADLAPTQANPRRNVGAAPEEGEQHEATQTNRLIALDLTASPDEQGRIAPAWTLGGTADEAAAPPALTGHFFLGPPLPVDDRLFAVTEFDRQLTLVALEPETGELLWSQGLAFADRPIQLDPARFPLACTPSWADGILVCPTHLGLLVGLDASSGMLLWAYYCGDKATAERIGRWTTAGRTAHGSAAYPNLPLVVGDKIVWLPRFSRQIHCVEASTGRELWTVDRKDAEYVAAHHDETLLVVGSRYARGLSIDSGAETWSKRVGLPSGRGVRTGRHYLLPLQEGRIATLDILSGEEIGNTFGESRQPQRSPERLAAADSPPHVPGNLIASRDAIISVGLRTLDVYPQAEPLLARTRDELRDVPAAADKLLLAAELEVSLGQRELAQQRLDEILQRSQLPAELRQRAQILARELYYLDLAAQPENEDRILAALDQLADTSLERGRFLVRKAEAQLQRGDFQGVLDSTREFATLELARPLPMGGNAAHLVSAASWVPAMLGRVQSSLPQADREAIRNQIADEQLQVLAVDDTARLRQFLDRYARWPEADAVRLRLADQLIATGQFQEAELLLLENRASDDEAARADSTRLLAELWNRLGLYREAALLLLELQEQYGGIEVSKGLTAREYVAAQRERPLLEAALRQATPPDWPIRRIEITNNYWGRLDLKHPEAFTKYRRRYPLPIDRTRLLLEHDGGDGKVSIIDTQTGTVTGAVDFPSRNAYPALDRNDHPGHYFVGHFFPLGSTGEMHGISLLEHADQKPLWTAAPRTVHSTREMMRIGPVGPSFCVFQDHRHLVVVHPATGRILWQRSDLDPECGLVNDPYSGIIGDGEVLVVFGADRTSYTLYRTTTGEELRRGTLDINLNQVRKVFGRKLFHVTRSGPPNRMRIWDPLDGTFDFDQPAIHILGTVRVYSAVMPTGELAVLMPHRLQILDAVAGKVLLDAELQNDDFENLSGLQAFRDHDRFYVNFQRESRAVVSRSYEYYASDTLLPAQHVNGDLYAFHIETGRRLWTHTLPQRTFLQTPHFRLPFLIGVSRVRDRWNGHRQSVLVEVIDAATGRILARRDNLFPDRLVHLDYKPDEGRINLDGLQTTIELRFDRTRQQLTPNEKPL